MLIVLTGLSAGALHVVSGSDHLAALAPLALGNRSTAVRSGATWGIGHGLGVVLVGLVAVALRNVVAAEWLSDGSEFLVGFLLLGVGAWAIRRASRLKLDEVEEHGHPHAALGVGLLHGAAGTTHVLGVLPALALSPGWAVAYLGCYLVGAVAAMTGFAATIGGIAQVGGPAAVRSLMAASGAVAMAVGVVWIASPIGH